MISSFEFVILLVVVVTCGKVLMRAIEAVSGRKSLPPSAGGEDVRQLREQVESLTERLDRLSEDQRFLTRLLEERPKPRDHGKTEETI